LKNPQIDANQDSNNLDSVIMPYLTNGILALFINWETKSKKDDTYIKETYLIRWNIGMTFPYKQDLPIKYELSHIPNFGTKWLNFYGFSVESKEIVFLETNQNNNSFVLTLKNGEWKRTNLETDYKETTLFSYPQNTEIPRLPFDGLRISLGETGNPISFSKNNELVANLDAVSGVLRIWNTKTGVRKLTLAFPQTLIGDTLNAKSRTILGFTNDGKHIRVIFKDGKIRYYPTSIEDYYKMAKEMLGEEIRNE
jgi:hypothetical protein